MANELKPCPFCGGKAHYTKEIASAGLAAVVTCSDNDCCTNHAETLQKAIDLWNTRPAAPVEGLETKGWEVKRYNNGGRWLGTALYIVKPSISSAAPTYVEELVARSQAEAIIAAERERANNFQAELWGCEIDLNAAKADNAALTVRVKELEADVSAYILSAEDQDKRRKALETQLAAARKALKSIADAPAWGFPEKWETTPAEVRQLARAALEGQPWRVRN